MKPIKLFGVDEKFKTFHKVKLKFVNKYECIFIELHTWEADE